MKCLWNWTEARPKIVVTSLGLRNSALRRDVGVAFKSATIRLAARVVQKSKCRVWCRLHKTRSHSQSSSCTQSCTQPQPSSIFVSSTATRLPRARVVRPQQLHRLLWLLCVFSNLGSPRVQNCREVEQQKPWRGNKMFVLLQSDILAKEVVWMSLFILHTHPTLLDSISGFTISARPTLRVSVPEV